MVILASTAVWLQKEVLNTLGDIINTEEIGQLVPKKRSKWKQLGI